MVARALLKLGRVPGFEMKPFCETVALCLAHTAVPLLGRGGDVYFAHPLLVHNPSSNMSDTPQWITNTGMKGESTVSLGTAFPANTCPGEQVSPVTTR